MKNKISILILLVFSFISASCLLTGTLRKPEDYGVYLQRENEYIEMPSTESTDYLSSDQVENVPVIANSQPVILVYDPNTNLPDLKLYSVDFQTQIEIDVQPSGKEMADVIPAVELPKGIYCLAQADQLTGPLLNYCFEISASGEDLASSAEDEAPGSTEELPISEATAFTEGQPLVEATPTSTSTLETKPTATPTEPEESLVIDMKINDADSMPMVYVPEGEFLMGSDPENDPDFWGAEGPSHKVYLDAFWIYQTEVTNTMYQACVEVQACPKPLRHESRMVEDYHINPRFAEYPVIQVNWVDAVSYCNWAGGRLPTEAEWEKTARGTDGRMFPWGNDGLESDLASFCGSSCPEDIRESFDDGYPEIAPVGSFPAGASPYGAFDMAGNVWEWVFDYFDPQYYSASPYDNPLGPISGDRRVIRGGGWHNFGEGLRTVARASMPPNDGLDTLGFRCVVDVTE